MLKRKLILASVAWLLTAPQVQAQPITFSFSSTVANVSPELASIASVGDTFSGSFTFESEALAEPSDAPGMRAIYPGAGSAITLKVGDYTASAEGFYITVLNDLIFEGQYVGDRFLVATTHESQFSGPQVGAFSLGYFALVILDPSGALFDGLSLPTTAAAFQGQAYDSFANLLLQQPINSNAFLGVSIGASDVNLWTVPEPGTLGLLTAAALGLVLGRVKRS